MNRSDGTFKTKKKSSQNSNSCSHGPKYKPARPIMDLKPGSSSFAFFLSFASFFFSLVDFFFAASFDFCAGRTFEF